MDLNKLRAKIANEETKFTANKKFLTSKKGQDAVVKSSLKEVLLLADVLYAKQEKIFDLLWLKVQYTIIALYRTKVRPMLDELMCQIKSWLADASREKPVRLHSAKKVLLGFLRAFAYYYRQLIQELIEKYSVKELFPIVKKFGLEASEENGDSITTERQKTAVVDFCYQFLIFLGDISRHKETFTKLKTDPPIDWGPALGYYNLARTIRPGFGTAYNQLAVVNTSKKTPIATFYYLHLACMVSKSSTEASHNIKTFLQQTQAYRYEDPGPADVLTEQLITLCSVDLGSKDVSVSGVSPGFESMCSMFLRQLQECAQSQFVSSTTIMRITIISLVRWSAAFDKKGFFVVCCQLIILDFLPFYPQVQVNYTYFAFALFLRLLSILKSEVVKSGVSKRGLPKDYSDLVTPPFRRVLGSIRVLSKWLILNESNHWQKLKSQDDATQSTCKIMIESFMDEYHVHLATFKSTFKNATLPVLKDWTKEDFDCRGLSFLEERVRAKSIPKTKLKLEYLLTFAEAGQPSSNTHPNVEALMRIRDILEDYEVLDTLTNAAKPMLDSDKEIPTTQKDESSARIDNRYTRSYSSVSSSNGLASSENIEIKSSIPHPTLSRTYSDESEVIMSTFLDKEEMDMPNALDAMVESLVELDDESTSDNEYATESHVPKPDNLMNTLTATDLLSRVRAIGMAEYDSSKSGLGQSSPLGLASPRSPILEAPENWNQASTYSKGILASPTFSYHDEIWADNYGRIVKKS